MNNPLNFFDRIVATVSPSNGIKRLHDRMLLNRYNAAMPKEPRTKRKNHFSKQTPNQLNQGAKALYQRARHADENNPFVTAILDELCANVVGPKGIMIEPQPLDHEGNVHVAFAQAISKWHELHSLTQNINGEMSRSETEWLACRTWLRDGEVFGRMFMGEHGDLNYPSVTPFAIQAFEPDFVPHHITEAQGGLMEGIKRNQFGQTESYLIQKDSKGFEYAEVDAGFICHLKFTRRLHQNRGISILHSAIDLADRIENYDFTEMLGHEIAAKFAFYVQRDKDMPNANELDQGGDIALGAANSFELAPGEKAGIVESNRKESASAEFRSSQQKLVSSAVGVNNSSVTRNYDGSYTSNRQELTDSHVKYKVLQREFVTNWTRPQYRHALTMAIMKGELKIPPTVDVNTILNAIYQAPVMPWIDPTKEMTGIEKGTRLGLFSLSHYQRERHVNPLSTRKEIKAERQQMKDDGIVSTSDPAHNLVETIQTNSNGEGTFNA
ncbi:phage portal protein [Vibrio cortegadensis]|uniref:phage portal protein n=1 Tax=Vibrio cortegadensis TaxID=1328770 RepID=UPI0021C2A92B|nr:phage portal protein [Vibrio cortegadensis]MDN3699188.1 phage portal protein [Vibrio cortegadensis]